MQRWIAESRVELEQARLLCYRCAWRLDQAGHHGAWRDVSLIKLAVPAMLQRIADRAMQVFGAMGGSEDAPIHQALAWGRLLRIGDGPDEVHLRQIFKMEAMPLGRSPIRPISPRIPRSFSFASQGGSS